MLRGRKARGGSILKESQGSLLGDMAELSDQVVGAIAEQMGYGNMGVVSAGVSDWLGGGNCPLAALESAGNRLAVMMDLERDCVLAGFTPGGETVWTMEEGGGEMVMSIDDLFKVWREIPKSESLDFPLTPVIRAFCEQPRVILADKRVLGRVLPAKLAMVAPGDSRGNGLFTPAAHVSGKGKDQLILPGFERQDTVAPVLPLLLYDMGVGEAVADPRAPGAPLPLRLFVESILAVRLFDRVGDGPVAMQITLRELLKWLYPGVRRPRPSEYWERLINASDVLDSAGARVPWYDSGLRRGGYRRVVSVGDIPRGPDCLEDEVRIIIDLPPGSETGPQVSNRLRHYGMRSAVAYRIMLHLAYRWHYPGRTLVPVRANGRRKRWVRSYDPSRYDYIADDELVQMAYPSSSNMSKRNLLVNARKWLGWLARDGELQMVDGKILPPLRGGGGVDEVVV